MLSGMRKEKLRFWLPATAKINDNAMHPAQMFLSFLELNRFCRDLHHMLVPANNPGTTKNVYLILIDRGSLLPRANNSPRRGRDAIKSASAEIKGTNRSGSPMPRKYIKVSPGGLTSSRRRVNG